MRVSRGPGSQRSQSSLPPSLHSPCASLLLTYCHTQTHTWLCSHGASVSVIAACHPYLSPLSVSESLALLPSISPPQRRPPLLFLCFLFSPSNKGPGPRLSITLDFSLLHLSLSSKTADCSIIHSHLASALFLIFFMSTQLNPESQAFSVLHRQVKESRAQSKSGKIFR